MPISAHAPADVAVAGGGTAGVVAAIAAARSGARTLLVEREGFVGGVAAMGLPLNGFYDNREEQIVKGIPWQIVERLRAIGAAVDVSNAAVGPPDGRGTPHFIARRILYRPEAYKYVALAMLRESGVEIMLHTFCSDVLKAGEAVTGLVVQNKAGTVRIPAGRVVDCTGDADIVAWAGGRFCKGRQPDGALQPVTPLFIMSNMDIDAALEGGARKSGLAVASPSDWPTVGRYTIDMAPWAAELRDEMPELAHGLQRFLIFDCGDGVFYTGNLMHLPGIDASDADDLSRAEVDTRIMVWRFTQFLRRRVPGFERSHLVATQAAPGVRETRRIVGEYVLTYDDVLEARRFDDAVTMAGFWVDIHSYDGGPGGHAPGRGTQVKDYGHYDIPYRCLLPLEIDNVLVAGRCLSADQPARGSAREMATCMAMGQAAGAAAALSVQRGVTPRGLDVALLRQTLLRQDACLRERAPGSGA